MEERGGRREEGGDCELRARRALPMSGLPCGGMEVVTADHPTKMPSNSTRSHLTLESSWTFEMYHSYYLIEVGAKGQPSDCSIEKTMYAGKRLQVDSRAGAHTAERNGQRLKQHERQPRYRRCR